MPAMMTRMIGTNPEHRRSRVDLESVGKPGVERSSRQRHRCYIHCQCNQEQPFRAAMKKMKQKQPPAPPGRRREGRFLAATERR